MQLKEVSPDGVFKTVDQTPEAQERRDMEVLTNFARVQGRKIVELEDTIAILQSRNAQDHEKFRKESDAVGPVLERLRDEGDVRQKAYEALERTVLHLQTTIASYDVKKVKELQDTVATQRATIAKLEYVAVDLSVARTVITNLKRTIEEQKVQITGLREEVRIPANLQYYAASLSKIIDGIAASPQQGGLPGKVQDMLNKIQMEPGPSGWQPTGVTPELEID